MSRKERIEELLQEGFAPVHLDIVDESYMHAVPTDAESHFKLLVVSESFEGIAMVERHRLVNQLLDEEFAQGLHALTMHTWTPEEWEAKGGVPESPPCLGGSQTA
ncbi:BolA family protein [Imhoffiella purpurea]|uniref:DNA-binding transcriptional regulator BolA n=1 Tax=Imhoffiella purpurea TaxID=1249627 RepID=W9VS35_9GAMM|nr:BolA family protein [Imhoffiella purpurea]EXJ13225.1 Cell division protein BolA [Imhoffiella purpurea]